MKTINDLIEYLNYNERDVYSLTDLEDKVLISREGIMGSILLMTVYKSNAGFPFEWHISSDFHFEQFSVQEKIMRFFINSNPNHWFDEPEKKYNIIIGKNEREKIKTAYQKLHDGTYIADSVEEDDLKTDRYIFTESEIEDLKSTLSEQMAKIVDLGKVEVKDDED